MQCSRKNITVSMKKYQSMETDPGMAERLQLADKNLKVDFTNFINVLKHVENIYTYIFIYKYERYKKDPNRTSDYEKYSI